ncbi:uncharacterized [Tachysurus ichikawai]
MDNLASDMVAPEHAHNHLPHNDTVTVLKDPNCSHYNLELIDLQPPQLSVEKKTSSSARGCEAGNRLMIVFYNKEIKPPHFTTKGSKTNVRQGNICHRFDCATFQAISNVIAETAYEQKRLVDAFPSF